MPFLTQAQARTMTEEERMDYLTRTVLGEAAGEGYVGMIVVGQVIANRTRDGRWPADPVAVAGQRHQFSTHSAVRGVGNQDRVARDYPPTSREYRMARAAIEATVVNRTAPDITGGAVHYHTIAMGYPRTWNDSARRYGHIDIGAHRVYPSRPVPPGDIPGAIERLMFEGELAATNIRTAGLAPIRPARMSDAVRLQRELNRTASQRANAPAIRSSIRTLAFQGATDPFEVGRPARGSSPIINRPQPAMRESMRRELRATGMPNSTARTTALQASQGGFDGDGRLRVSTRQFVSSAPPVATRPGVRETVAANVAAAAAAAGRDQLVMTGNPNRAGSVVEWLYPSIPEGQGEANQANKQARARNAQTNIALQRNEQRALPRQPARTAAPAPDMVSESMRRTGQAQSATLAQSLVARRTAQDVRTLREAEQNAVPTPRSSSSAGSNRNEQRSEQRTLPRDPPRLVTVNGRPAVVRESATLSPDMISESMRRAEGAQSATLAASIAARRTAQDVRTLREAEQRATPVPRSSASAASNRNDQRTEQRALPASPARAAPTPAPSRPAPQATSQNIRTMRDADQQSMRPVPGPTAPPKDAARLPQGNRAITPAPTPAPRPTDRRSAPTRQLPPLAPPSRVDPIGTMPSLADLATLRPDPIRAAPSVPARRPSTAPTPAPASARPAVRSVAPAPAPAAPRPAAPSPLPASARPNSGIGEPPRTVVRPSVPIRVAPTPAPASARPAARAPTPAPASARPARIAPTPAPASARPASARPTVVAPVPRPAAARPTTVAPAAVAAVRPRVAARPVVTTARAAPVSRLPSAAPTPSAPSVARHTSAVQSLRDKGMTSAQAYGALNSAARSGDSQSWATQDRTRDNDGGASSLTG